MAFETDFFPIAGAKDTFEEAKRFYGLFGATDAVQLIHGQGGHCNLGPVSSQVFAFLTRHLKGPGAPVATFTPARPKNPDALTVTVDGQAAMSLGSLTVEELARRRAQQITPAAAPIASAAAVERLRTRVQRDIRSLASVTAVAGASPKATTAPKGTGDGFGTESITLEGEAGVTLAGIVAVPEKAGSHRAILWMDATPLDDIAASADVTRLAKSGAVVLALHPRGVLGEPPPNPNQLALGPYMALFQRAVAVGKTIVGLRVDDTIRAVDWLAARPDVDKAAITVSPPARRGWWRSMPPPSIRGSRGWWSSGRWCRIGPLSRRGCTRTCPRS
ncbi:MAG: hypothetical protein ABIT71_20905 [Vicinamibacteraceae bacterium]